MIFWVYPSLKGLVIVQGMQIPLLVFMEIQLSLLFSAVIWYSSDNDYISDKVSKVIIPESVLRLDHHKMLTVTRIYIILFILVKVSWILFTSWNMAFKAKIAYMYKQ